MPLMREKTLVNFPIFLVESRVAFVQLGVAVSRGRYTCPNLKRAIECPRNPGADARSTPFPHRPVTYLFGHTRAVHRAPPYLFTAGTLTRFLIGNNTPTSCLLLLSRIEAALARYIHRGLQFKSCTTKDS